MFVQDRFPKEIRQQTILGVLIGGFTLVIVLMLLAGYIGFSNISLIRANAKILVTQDLSATGLIDQIQSEQAALGWVFHKMAEDPESMDRADALQELHDAEDTMQRLVQEVDGKPQAKLWQKLQVSTTGFADEARRLLALETIPDGLSRDLFQKEREVLALTGQIIRANDKDNIESQRQIVQSSHQLLIRSAVLFGTCLCLAILFAVLTVRVTTALFRRMEWQAGELSRVSWHMLEDQETTARRFSHELHDELGQSLTAVKANLAALEHAEHEDTGKVQERIDDCLTQVNEAIGNVRQLSQLLRPIILDDFGLDAALRWLAERFQQRTRIDVEYQSNFTGRLVDETETHLFRISQEALTNIARHSGATQVKLSLTAENGMIHLSVADNGRGLPPNAEVSENAAKPSLGMTGMRARARSLGGKLNFSSGNGNALGNGLCIDVSLPLTPNGDQKNPHPVSR